MTLQERYNKITTAKASLLELLKRQGTEEEADADEDNARALQRLIMLKELEVNAHPGSFDTAYLWIVEVSSSATISDATILEQLSKLGIDPIPQRHTLVPSLKESAVCDWLEKADPLFATVRMSTEKLRFEPTYVSGGHGGWMLGFYCTEPQSRMLCRKLYQDFEEHIDTGILHVVRQAWRVEQTNGDRPGPTFALEVTVIPTTSNNFLHKKASPRTVAPWERWCMRTKIIIGVLLSLLPFPISAAGILLLPSTYMSMHPIYSRDQHLWWLYQVVVTYLALSALVYYKIV